MSNDSNDRTSDSVDWREPAILAPRERQTNIARDITVGRRREIREKLLRGWNRRRVRAHMNDRGVHKAAVSEMCDSIQEENVKVLSYCRDAIGLGWSDERIEMGIRGAFKWSPKHARLAIMRTRADIRAAINRNENDLVGESLELYRLIYSDSRQTGVARVAARRQADKLLGLEAAPKVPVNAKADEFGDVRGGTTLTPPQREARIRSLLAEARGRIASGDIIDTTIVEQGEGESDG